MSSGLHGSLKRELWNCEELIKTVVPLFQNVSRFDFSAVAEYSIWQGVVSAIRVHLFVFLPNPANSRKRNFGRNFAEFR